MSNLVIGIEGLVGAGKTTICRNLINKIPIVLYGLEFELRSACRGYIADN